jgi:hypothetical protein
MLARIQEFTPKQLAVPDPVAKQPSPGEEFSVSLDGATLTLLLDEMSKMGLDTSKLQISNTGNPQPSGAGSATSASSSAKLTPFDPQPAPMATSAPAAGTSPAISDAEFVPEFQQDPKVFSVYGTSSGLNPAYFATRETAEWIAKKYGTGEVVEVPYEGNGGPYFANATEFQIRLSNGKLTNAGTLADYYRRMPESQFPGVADSMIRSVLISDNGPGIV